MNSLIRGGVPRLGGYSAMAVDLYREGKTGQTGKVLDKTQERGYKDHHLGLMKRRSPHCEEKVVGAVKPLMQCKGVTWLEEMVSQDISYLNFLCGTPGCPV
ncbi:hypothetical protein D5086_026093 [Populus alba]|uniref:Uncharacterized protein n=1 Tax=Populus alba TaxID=43335 RepID=A0ACC4B0Z5_POPAL